MRRRPRGLLLPIAALALMCACGPEPARQEASVEGTTMHAAPPGLPPRPPGVPLPIPSGYPDEGLDPAIAAGYAQDGAWVVGTGVVERILRDDSKPPRHQRFVVRIGFERTLLVAHNIDLAPRVPVKEGDMIAFRGEYVWNEQGGIVHYTHRKGRGRDPEGGGWIVRNEQGYR